MLMAALILLLIIVIVFREEIRALIAIGVAAAVINALWASPTWWGKPAAIVVTLLAVAAVIGNLVQRWPHSNGGTAPAGAAHESAAPAAPRQYAGGLDDWFYRFNGKEYGPVPKHRLLHLLEMGQIPPITPVRYMDGPWTPANQMISFKR